MAHNAQNEVVITGISGRFPDCDSVQELKEKLYGGIDVVTDKIKYFNWGNFLFIFLQISYRVLYNNGKNGRLTDQFFKKEKLLEA